MRILSRLDVCFRADFVCLSPNKRHSGQGWECLKVTQTVSKRFSRDRDEILNQEVGLRGNNDSSTLPSGFNCCAIDLGVRVFTRPGP